MGDAVGFFLAVFFGCCCLEAAMDLLFIRMSGFSSSSSSASFSTGNDGGASKWPILMRDGCVRTESCVKIGWFSLAAVASSMLIDNNNSGTADADSLSEDWQLLGVAMRLDVGSFYLFIKWN